MPGKKKKEELTPDEYLQQARDEIQNIKKEWVIFLKTGIVMLAALIAIIVAGIAWFVSNNRVKVTGTKIQAAGSEFDLAAAGTESGVYDKILNVSPGANLSVENKNFSSTDGSHTSITWAITDDNNINNKNINGGIEPGSSGSLTFYIISHKDGALHVTLNPALIGYAGKENVSTSDDIQQLSGESEGQQLLEGHVLLFAGYDSNKKHYQGWISEDAEPWTIELDSDKEFVLLKRNENGSLTWENANAKKNTAYPVTIYWIWPEALESYLMSETAYTGRRPLLFAKDSTGDNNSPETLPTGLFEVMCTSNDSVTFNRYFCWETEDAFKEDVTSDKLSQMRKNFNPVIYGTLSTYYNLADQYLGENVRFVKLKLDAQ